MTAVQGTNTTVTLSGAFTNFTPGVTTAFFGAGVSAGTVTVNGPSLASVPISVDAGALTGPRSITVVTGSESVTLVNGFTVQQGTPAVLSINPNAGQRGLTHNVTITGAFTNWQDGVTSVSYGPGIVVNSNQVHSATSLTTSISIDSGSDARPARCRHHDGRQHADRARRLRGQRHGHHRAGRAHDQPAVWHSRGTAEPGHHRRIQRAAGPDNRHLVDGPTV